MGIFDLFKPKPNVEEMEKNGGILGLIKILKRRSSDDLRKRSDVERRAISTLGRIGEPAVEPLIQALQFLESLARVLLI